MAELSRPPQQQKLNGAYYIPNAYPVGSNRKRASSSSPSSSRRSRIGFCCRCLCSTLLALIVALGIAALVLWLLFRPKIPKYAVEEVRINALDLPSGSRSVDTDIALAVRADNPNKRITIKYSGIATRVWFMGAQLGAGSTPGFAQGRRNSTLVRSSIRGSRVAVAPGTATALRSAIARGSVALESETVVRAKIKAGSATSPWFRVRVRCALRVAPPGASGGARLLAKSCKIKRSAKFW